MNTCVGLFEFFNEHWFLAFIALLILAGFIINTLTILNNLIILANNKRRQTTEERSAEALAEFNKTRSP